MKKNLRYPAFILGFLLAAVVFFPGACVQPPGKGKLAGEGRAVSALIVGALENYKKDHGKYPRYLNELVPGYLESDPTRKENSEINYTYFPGEENNSYRLRFSYPGFMGTDDCTYSSTDEVWRCGGTM